MTGSVQHIYLAREIDSGSREKLGPAERAFMEIASKDAERRRLVIPLIRGEMKRRSQPRTPEATAGASVAGAVFGNREAAGVRGQKPEASNTAILASSASLLLASYFLLVASMGGL